MISLLNNKPFKCRKYTSELYLMLKLNLSYEHLRRMWVARVRIELFVIVESPIPCRYVRSKLFKNQEARWNHRMAIYLK
jgi:hypothetical protein